MADYLEHLRAVEEQVPTASADRPRILNRLHALRGEVRNLERLLENEEPMPEATTGGGGIAGTVTATDTGLPVGFTTVELWSSTGAFGGTDLTNAAGEFEFSGLAADSYYVTTFGPDNLIDELYADMPCPGGGFEGCDPTTGTPVVVDGLTTTPGIDFVLEAGAMIEGDVTNGVSGEPILSFDIDIWDGAGALVVSTRFNNTGGHYAVGGLPTGSYFLSTDRASGQVDELYDDIPCPGGAPDGCDPTTGTAVVATAGSTIFGIDFELGGLGAITGRVTDALTGAPLRFVTVGASKPDGSFGGSDLTDSQGEYEITGLEPGSYFVTTGNFDSYRNEVFDDIPCISCDPTIGDPVTVTVDSATPGIDFALDRLGAITGQLTDAVTGAGIPFVNVRVWDSVGGVEAFLATDFSGHYASEGLNPGDYFVTTRSFDFDAEYLDELYDDLPCPKIGNTYDCDPTTGTAVAAIINTSSTADFALGKSGSITGSVVDSQTNEPLRTTVELWRDGSVVTTRIPNAAGEYLFAGLIPADYVVSTQGASHRDELYDDVPCLGPSFSECDPALGMPLVVVAGAVFADIDLALDRLGVIAGTILDGTTGAGLAGGLRLYADDGTLEATGSSDATGAYLFSGLDPGNYFLSTRLNGPYLDELYADIPCPGGFGCTPVTGQAIATALNTVTAGIDFELQLEGTVSGTVTDAMNGLPLAGAGVVQWNALGGQVGFAMTNSQGKYRFDAEPPGTFFVTTDIADPGGKYFDELYDDLPCVSGGLDCDPTRGTPIVLAADQVVTAIDFALEGPGGIVGRITHDVSGAPLPGVLVEVWSATGDDIDVVETDLDGRYSSALAPGEYFVTTFNLFGLLDELYDDLPCSKGGGNGCDPTTGVPIQVLAETITGDIDFSLGFTLFADGFESGDTSSWSSTVGGTR